MQRVNGSPCEQCGCEAATLVGRETWWGRAVETLQCDHCKEVRQVPVDEDDGDKPKKSVVVWSRIKCPKCNSADIKTTSTRGTTRWHKCRSCQHAFQSIEKN